MKQSGRLFLLLTLAISHTMAIGSTDKVIYGEDDRQEVISTDNNLHVELAASTAAMISTSSLTAIDGNLVNIKGSSFKERMNMCASERFVSQLSAANCSGFLVGPDLIVTAGHCIRTQYDCESYAWVFDFAVEHEGQTAHKVSTDSVYRCEKIIERSLNSSNSDDYALIKLSRTVTGKTPLKYRTTGSVQNGDELVVIGHPSGIPTKIAAGAEVKSQNAVYFSANLDTYGGNSGSAVFNATSGVIEGILVRGNTDYVFQNGCRVSNLLSDDHGRYEDITKITNISALRSE